MFKQLIDAPKRAHYTTRYTYVPDLNSRNPQRYLNWTWTVKEVYKNIVESDEDGYGINQWHLVVETNTPVDEGTLYRVMLDQFRRGCACERDCCGHLTGGVHDIVRINATTVIVMVSYSENY